MGKSFDFTHTCALQHIRLLILFIYNWKSENLIRILWNNLLHNLEFVCSLFLTQTFIELGWLSLFDKCESLGKANVRIRILGGFFNAFEYGRSYGKFDIILSSLQFIFIVQFLLSPVECELKIDLNGWIWTFQFSTSGISHLYESPRPGILFYFFIFFCMLHLLLIWLNLCAYNRVKLVFLPLTPSLFYIVGQECDVDTKICCSYLVGTIFMLWNE